MITTKPLVSVCKTTFDNAIPQIVFDSDVEYVPKSIALSIAVRPTDGLIFVPKFTLTSQSESPYLEVVSSAKP